MKTFIRSTAASTLFVGLCAAASGCAAPASSTSKSSPAFSNTYAAHDVAGPNARPINPAAGRTAASTNSKAPFREYQAPPTTVVKPASDVADRPAAAPPPVTPARSDVAFGQPQPQPSAAKPAPAPKASRALDLYGELDGGAAGPVAGSQLDGSTNLVQVSFASEGACVDPDIDRSGNLLVFASTMHRRTSDIYLKSVNGKTLTQLSSDPADDVMPAFSPDGTKIAFASNRSGNWDIYITGIAGGPPTQISNENDAELHPTWSPDGRFVAYCRFGAQSSRWEIWMTDVANPGVKRFLDYGVFPEWCPDVARSKIAFQRAKQRGSRDYGIWTIDVDMASGQASQPTEIVSAANAALINPCWSPDGSRIAFVAVIDPQADGARPQQSDVWVVNVDGSGRTNLTNGQFANFQPAWAADGSVYFVSDRSGIDNVWAVKAGRNAMDKPQPSEVANADNGSTHE